MLTRPKAIFPSQTIAHFSFVSSAKNFFVCRSKDLCFVQVCSLDVPSFTLGGAVTLKVFVGQHLLSYDERTISAI